MGPDPDRHPAVTRRRWLTVGVVAYVVADIAGAVFILKWGIPWALGR